MTYPLPWLPRPERGTARPEEVAALERWLASGLETFATTHQAVPGRCVRVWTGRRRLRAYDDTTGEILATIPRPPNTRHFRGTEVPPCSH